MQTKKYAANNIMNRHLRTILVLAGFVLFASACSTQTGHALVENQSSGSPMLRPGDTIDEMVITTGAAEASPLWVYCSAPLESTQVTTVDCDIPQLPKLAIGYIFGLNEEDLQSLDWATKAWKLYVDDHPIDLGAFGTYDFAVPGLANHPSQVREVFRKMTVWDIVLENPKPGRYTLRGLTQVRANTYTWLVNLTVAVPTP
jgi:hypothetical protein